MNRDIFQYHNGTSEVFADPLVVRCKLVQTAMEGGADFFDLEAKVRAIDATDDPLVIHQGIMAINALVDIARKVFSMTSFDTTTGKGSTAEECLAVTKAFQAFMAQKKTKQERMPTTSTPTESTPQQPIPATTATMSG